MPRLQGLEPLAEHREFASPEQFAGVAVDIRSDVYSLGAMLWEMLAGRVPFGGSPAEVMYQHQHAPLPLD
jgi:serine/threonine protein kinase